MTYIFPRNPKVFIKAPSMPMYMNFESVSKNSKFAAQGIFIVLGDLGKIT